MDTARRVRFAGTCGMVGTALWVSAVLIEYHFALQPPGSGALFYRNQAVFC